MRVMGAQQENGGEQLTIDELAQRTGMTVRNIRAHQSRGLLPPPEVRARTGYYGSDHVARIKLIQEMQAEGYNLKAIERLAQGATRGVGGGGRIKQAGRKTLCGAEPVQVTAEGPSERI